MKTKGSFARTICIWIITVLIVTVFVGGTCALICRTQIGEAISYHRLEEDNEKGIGGAAQGILIKEKNEKGEHDFENKFSVLNKLTPLTSSQKITVIILCSFWAAVVLLYWFSVTALLAERAELIKFNRHIWFWLAFFTNIIAVIAFMFIKKVFVKKCPQCGNYQTSGAYCTECGNALEIKCSQCGKVLKHGTAYCPQCGKKV